MLTSMYQRPSGRIYEKLNKRKRIIMDKFAITMVGWIVFAVSYFLIKVTLYWILA